MNVLSLGAGVQSTTVLLMSLAGELPPLDAAIFADTGWEPQAVYAHLWRLVEHAHDRIPIHIVHAEKVPLRSARGINEMPFYISTPARNGGMARRQCTHHYKIYPIEAKLRRLLGVEKHKWMPKDAHLAQWFGISTDESHRMRDSKHFWVTNHYPLIDAGMSRSDCESWLSSHNWTAPKSACIGCPFHSSAEWAHIKATDPIAWADAIEVDESLRSSWIPRGIKEGQAFLHHSRTPLATVDLSTSQDGGWDNECEGVCGV